MQLNEDFNVYRQEMISVYHHVNDLVVAQEVGRRLYLNIDEFQRVVGLYPEIEVRVVIAQDKKQYELFIEGFPRMFEFSQAFYNPRINTIFIRNIDEMGNMERLHTVVFHEYIHLFINFFWEKIPLWFNEGTAVFFSENISWDRQFIFVRNYIFNRKMNLADVVLTYPDITGEYADHQDVWQYFYTVSALAVRYLYNNHREGFYRFWEYTNSDQRSGELNFEDFNRIFLQSFLLTPGMFYAEFEVYLQKYAITSFFIYIGGLLWGILPFILIIARLKKWFREKKIIRNWGEDKAETDNCFDKKELV